MGNRDVVIARLFQYFVGTGQNPTPTPGATCDVLVGPDADHRLADEVAAATDGLVFAPRAMAGSLRTGDERLVTYAVDPFDPREWAFDLGGVTIRREGYTEGTFTPVSCPTVVTVESADDLEHLVSDAVCAVSAGVLPDLALHPLVAFGDQCALGLLPCAAAGHGRAFVDSTLVRSGPHGGPASHAPTSEPVCAGCLDGVLRNDEAASAVASHPWLARYLTVLSVIREVRDRLPDGPRVSGFGWRANDKLGYPPSEPADAPVLLGHQDGHWVVDPRTREFARVGRDVVRVVEALVAEPYEDPVEAVAEQLDLELAASRDVIRRLSPLLDRVLPTPVLVAPELSSPQPAVR